MPNEINWQAYKAEVAKEMLPLMYRNCGITAFVSNHSQQAIIDALKDQQQKYFI